MSGMLEQAIVDAEALKEAATKNAETLILEKYSDQIRGAVESLLEQDDPMANMMEAGLDTDPNQFAPDAPVEEDAALGDLGEEEEVVPGDNGAPSIMEHIPLAVTSENDDQIEIPLDKLLEEVTNLSEAMGFAGSDTVMDPELSEYDSLEEDYFLEEDMLDEEAMLDEDCLDEGCGDNEEVYEEEIELEEDLLESLVVDHKPVGSGWAGTPRSIVELAEEEILALEQDAEVAEEKKALRDAVRKLSEANTFIKEQNQKLTSTLNKSASYMTRLKDVVVTLEEKLDKASVDNAKLLYQNKAFTSDSLNERQKQKLAEAVSNAETIEEAKVIFETLQNTVGSTSRKTQPNSLSEAVQKTTSVILSSRKNDSSRESKSNPTLNRWKFLAGIDK